MLSQQHTSQITISTPDLEASLQHYAKLGFRLVGKSQSPNPWAYITDESLLLLLSQDDQNFFGLTYFLPDVDALLKQLWGREISPAAKQEDERGTRFALLLSPDDFGIALVRHTGEGIFQPSGPTLKTFPPEEMGNPKKYPNAQLGIFGEFCHAVVDLERSKSWWEKLGFESLSVNASPYPWGILALGQHIIGLHQTKDFDRPALTYFAKDSGMKAEALRAKVGTQVREFAGTGGDANNVVISSPEGQQVFLFSF